MYGMASLSSTFALLLVIESSIKSKHVQKVSGVYLCNFWFSALLWDLFNFLLPCLLMLVSVTSGLNVCVVRLHVLTCVFSPLFRWCSRLLESRPSLRTTTS